MAPNPDLYARMAVPYDSNEAARAALKAFMEDVAALREMGPKLLAVLGERKAAS